MNDRGLKGGYLWFATSSKKVDRKIRQVGKFVAYKKCFWKSRKNRFKLRMG